MADWTPLPNQAVGVGGLPSGTTVTALRDNPIAIAEGAAGAPRIVGDALNLRIAEVDPAGMESVVFTDLEPADWALEFYTIQPDTTASRILFLDFSVDNGVTFLPNSDVAISINTNWRNTTNRLGGLSGVATVSNVMVQAITFAPRPDSRDANDLLVTPNSSASSAVINLHRDKPFSPPNAMRIRWSSGLFGANANQRIRLYQGGRRPFGGKP